MSRFLKWIESLWWDWASTHEIVADLVWGIGTLIFGLICAFVGLVVLLLSIWLASNIVGI